MHDYRCLELFEKQHRIATTPQQYVAGFDQKTIDECNELAEQETELMNDLREHQDFSEGKDDEGESFDDEDS